MSMLWSIAVLLVVLWLGGSVLGVAGGVTHLLLAAAAVFLLSFLKPTVDRTTGEEVGVIARRRVVCRVPAAAPGGVRGTAPR